jgi:magnesium-protoporphyrin O-methyltransferase
LCFKQSEPGGELAIYRKQGPSKSTRILLDTLKSAGVIGQTLLDIGGGVGILQFELLDAGAGRVVSVETSTTYLQAAHEEADRRHYTDSIQSYHGDFVDLAAEIPQADIVTLDRVLCCYQDVTALVE